MAIDKLLTNTSIGLGVEEVTAGTYVDPTVADVKIYDLAPIKVDMAPTRTGSYASGSFKKAQNISGIRTASTSFKINLQSSGTPTIAPKSGRYFKSSGLHEYTDTNIGYRYDGIPTCQTISFKDNMYDCGPLPEGYGSAIRGAVGTMTISADDVGEPIVCNFEYSGPAVPDIDIAPNAPIVPSGFDTAVCEKLLGVTFTLGGITREVESFTVSFQTVASMLKNSGNTEGVDQGSLVDGDAQLEITLRKRAVSVQDHYSDQANDTINSTAVLSLQTWDLTFTNLETTDYGTEDGDGIALTTLTLPFDEFTMIQK